MSLSDPRLAAVYDIDNPAGPDHDYFRSVADEVDARDIIDLGCGTGLLTVTLTRPGRTVTGIDPDPAMLERAATRTGGDAVTWRLGTADQLHKGADLVIMSGNVAMHIIGEDWYRTLTFIAGSLTPGGILVFESRNPEAEAWAQWNEALSERQTPVGLLRESCSTDPPDPDGVVVMHCYNEFAETGDVVEGDLPLQFRSREQIMADLQSAGLEPRAIYRNWRSDPFTGGPEQPLMVIRAHRRDE